jgi:hypothetical protein
MRPNPARVGGWTGGPFDKSARSDGSFAREDFAYDHEGDVYVRPAGKTLTSSGTLVNDGATLLYRASKYDCDACELKPRCCRTRRRARSRAQSTKPPVTWRATSPGPTPR